MGHRPTATAGPPSRSRLRGALLLAVVVAFALLAWVVAAEPGRIGILLGLPGIPGRTAGPSEPAWVLEAPAPIALTEVAAVAHDGRVWVVGGMDAEGRASDRVLVYDPATDTWADGPPLPVAVHHAALVSEGDSLFLIGGYVGGGAGAPTDAVWRLEPGGSWAPDRPLPEARAAGAAASTGGGQIMYGGGVGPAGVSAQVFVQEGDGWRVLTALSEPREHLAATSLGAGTVTFLGGRVGGLNSNLGTVDLVSSSGVVGRTEDLTTARGGIAAFSTADLGDCVVGGEGPQGTFGVVECIGTSHRTTLPGLTVPRHGLGAVVVDGRAYALLGGRQPGLTVSDVVEVLDLR